MNDNMTLNDRVADLVQRVSKLESKLGVSSPLPKGISAIILDKEYDRIIERMKIIRNTYGDMQTWMKSDVEEYRQLKARRGEIKKLLGIKY